MIEPLDWTTKSNTAFPYASVASAKDLLAYYDISSNAVIAIRRRNSQGGYDLVANFTSSVNPKVRTNGKWIWTEESSLALFSIDENNKLSEPNYFPPVGGNVLSDDTFVAYDPDSPDGNYTIKTYQYYPSNNTWSPIPGTELNVTTPVKSSYDLQSYRVYDNHLVLTDLTDPNNVSVKLYQRQPDKSWSLTDTIPVVNVEIEVSPVSVHYNEIDTIVFAHMTTGANNSEGIVYIYTKKNNVWNEQMFYATNVGYYPVGNLGASATFIDANTLLLSAGTESFFSKAPTNIGKVLMLTRSNGGDWTPYLDIVGNGADIFGLSIAVNDYDLIVHEYSLVTKNGRFRVYTAPLCFARPLNVTCKNEQVSDCSSLANSDLYTINSSPRCGTITPFFNSLSVVNSKVEAQFTFTRFGEDFSCNATLTCPGPAPVRAPAKPTSSASFVQFGLASLGVFLAAVWML